MSDIYFKCECGKSLAVDEAGIGRAVSCVDCGSPVLVPEPDFEFDCERCGERQLAPASISGDRIKCAACGHRQAVPSVTQEDAVRASVGRDSIPASPSSPSSVMASLMRRRSDFTIRRKPPRRSLRERIVPALPTWLLRAAAIFALLILTRELMRDWSHEDMPQGEAIVMNSHEEQQANTENGIVSGMAAQEEPVEPDPMPVPAPEMASLASSAQPATPKPELQSKPETTIELSAPLSALASVPPPDTILSEAKNPAIKLAEAPSVESEELRLLREKAAALPTGEEKYRLLNEIFFKKQPPALQKLHIESQKLLQPLHGLNRDVALRERLEKCNKLFTEYNKTHPGKFCDAHFWFSAGLLIRGEAIRAAKDYNQAEEILRKTWVELDALDSDASRSALRLRLALGTETAQAWVGRSTTEVSRLFDELEEMAMGAEWNDVRDIWGPEARSLRTRFMKYAENVPDEQRAEFMARQRQQLEKHLLDDSAPKRNRAAALRGWITLLDKQGSLTDALPLIEKWQEKYAGEPLDMNYLFSRMWVELYGEGNWEKAEKTMLLATREARQGGRFLDKSDYADVINLFYELQFQAGYELQRRRTIRQKAEMRDTWQTASSKGRSK